MISFPAVAFALSILASTAALTGCGGSDAPTLETLVEAEVRAQTPAGWEPVSVEMGEFEEAGVVNRSNVRFELTVAPAEPMARLIENVDGVNIVQPVQAARYSNWSEAITEESAADNADPLEVKLFGSARVIEPVAGSDQTETIVRIEWRTGTTNLSADGDASLQPLSTLHPYAVEGSPEAAAIRQQRTDREIAEADAAEQQRLADLARAEMAELEEAKIKSQQRLERQAMVEGEQLEAERIATKARLEKQRLARLTLDETDAGRWIDGEQFLTSPGDPLTDVVVEGRVPLSPGRVFGLLTTDAGMQAFTGMHLNAELRIGGRYELDTTPRDNTTGVWSGRVLAFRPGELLVVGLPPESDFGQRGPNKAVVFFTMREITETAEDGAESISTSLRIVQTGMPTGPGWDQVREQANLRWTRFIANMQQAVATGRVQP